MQHINKLLDLSVDLSRIYISLYVCMIQKLGCKKRTLPMVDCIKEYDHISSSLSLKLQANPDLNCCLGVFGLSLFSTERELREVSF